MTHDADEDTMPFCEHEWEWHPQPIRNLRACGWQCVRCEIGTFRNPHEEPSGASG